MSSDPEQDYFADGVVEDIITALSRFHLIVVIARNSSFVYKGQAVDVRQVAAELGVGYVLEGSVRRAGGRLRITAQLIEGATGAHLWADNFDGALDEVFAFQDQITQSAVAVIEPLVKRSEIERARQKPPNSLSAYDLYLQALALVLTTEPGANARTIELIELSLALDPNFAPALAVAANAYQARYDRQLPGVSEEGRRKGLGYAHAAVAMAGTDANTRAAAGLALLTLGGEYEVGLAALQRAVADNPNSVNVISYAGVGALWAGALDEAERHFVRALALNPTDLGGHWLFSGIAHVRMAQRRFEEARDWAARGYAASPTNTVALWLLIAANAHLGRMEEAKRWWSSLRELQPSTTLAEVRRGQQMAEPDRIEVIIDGLRMAGVPEQ